MKKTTMWLSALTLLAAQACAAVPDETAPPAIGEQVETALGPVVTASAAEPAFWRLEDRMAFHRVPGLSIAVVRDGEIVWSQSYGAADAETGRPVTSQTLFQAASVSKPVAAFGALRMVDAGLIELDAPINDALRTWRLEDGAYADAPPVTLRGLLAHTAGLSVSGFGGYPAGSELPTVYDILNGAEPSNTGPVERISPPDTEWRYSGGGYTLAQLAMADVAREAFPQLMERLVLGPVGMDASTFDAELGWRAPELTARAHAAPGDRPVEGGSHAYPEYAAAGLWTTAEDLARFAMALGDAASGAPDALISADLMAEAMQIYFDEEPYGLGFEVIDTGDGPVLSHPGGNYGFRSHMFTYSDGRGGAVILTNGSNGLDLIAEIHVALSRTMGWAHGAPDMIDALDPGETAAWLAGAYAAEIPDGVIEARIAAVTDALSIEVRRAEQVLLPATRAWLTAEGVLRLETGDSFQVNRDGSAASLIYNGLEFTRRD
jgi:CubicO group peptidase (beta-lactamase class C family)